MTGGKARPGNKENKVIIRKNELGFVRKENIRGGRGKALAANYIEEGAQLHIKFISLIELEPNAAIGEHLHDGDEEFYIVTKGSGSGILDGGRFEIAEGDAFVCKTGHSHGIEASEKGLSFIAVLSRA